jgi:hypothetical protein
VPDARRPSLGAPKGNVNGNYRQGRFTCEVIEARRQLAAWIKEMNQLADVA